MARAEASIHIDAPPEAVFDFVADASRIPEYVGFVRDVFDATPGPARAGTTLKEHAKPGLLPVVTHWRIDRFERPTRQIWVGRQADMEMTLAKYIEAEDGGTRYRQVMDYRMLPKVRPLGWLLERLVVARQMKSEFSRITASVKEIIESEQVAGSRSGTDR